MKNQKRLYVKNPLPFFEKKQLPNPKCETSAIDDNLKLGEKLGISGTPALIMPDGRVISGFKEADAIIELVGN